MMSNLIYKPVNEGGALLEYSLETKSSLKIEPTSQETGSMLYDHAAQQARE